MGKKPVSKFTKLSSSGLALAALTLLGTLAPCRAQTLPLEVILNDIVPRPQTVPPPTPGSVSESEPPSLPAQPSPSPASAPAPSRSQPRFTPAPPSGEPLPPIPRISATPQAVPQWVPGTASGELLQGVAPREFSEQLTYNASREARLTQVASEISPPLKPEASVVIAGFMISRDLLRLLDLLEVSSNSVRIRFVRY